MAALDTSRLFTLVGLLLPAVAPVSPATPEAGAVTFVDESESGHFLRFAAAGDGAIEILVDPDLDGDYPSFAVEGDPLPGTKLSFVVRRTDLPLAPESLVASGSWRLLPISWTAGEVRFDLTLSGASRTAVRLWSLADVAPGPAAGGSGGGASRGLNGCASACYAPNNSFCYDFDRIRCHMNYVARLPHTTLQILGWTQPCPDALESHRPRELYKLRVTDESVPAGEKTRIVLTSRVHGGERLASFIVEGLIEYALGLPVEGEAGLLPPVPARPADLLRKLEIIVYPCLNPDGSSDLDGDGVADFDRLKCGIDMNRRWGTPNEDVEAREIHVIHQDILREARIKPFRYHRDFHGWSRPNQGGIRHGVGIWDDALGFEAIEVTPDYFNLESFILEAEHERIHYRDPRNYLVGKPSDPPTPGTARFSLYRELSETGLVSNTSESVWELDGGDVISDPPYESGDDLRLEGAWLLRAWYETLPALEAAPVFQFIRGDANADGNVNISDVILILSHLFRGAQLYCNSPADLDGDGLISLTDAIFLVEYSFLGGPRPAAPFPDCAPPPAGNGGVASHSLRPASNSPLKKCFVGESEASRFGSRRRTEVDPEDRVGELTQRRTERTGRSPNDFFNGLPSLVIFFGPLP